MRRFPEIQKFVDMVIAKRESDFAKDTCSAIRQVALENSLTGSEASRLCYEFGGQPNPIFAIGIPEADEWRKKVGMEGKLLRWSEPPPSEETVRRI